MPQLLRQQDFRFRSVYDVVRLRLYLIPSILRLYSYEITLIILHNSVFGLYFQVLRVNN